MRIFSVEGGEDGRMRFRSSFKRCFLSARCPPWPKIAVQEADARTPSRRSAVRALTRSTVAALGLRVYPPGARQAEDAGEGEEREGTQAPPTGTAPAR